MRSHACGSVSRERPTTSVQLVTSELMLALLAVAVVSMR
jgi:hypothetical protein